MRLSAATIAQLPSGVDRFSYDRAAQAIGIMHFGIGAFHRAHQAWYTDRAMDRGDRDWAITGVSMRSAEVANQLDPQDGLYTVAERSETEMALRLIGAVRRVLVAGRDRSAIVVMLAAPATRIASFTITEKGYARAPDGALDRALAGEGSIYPLLHDGLARRRDAGRAGLTLLSCDNLADNGRQLARLLDGYLRGRDPALADWVEQNCAFPGTMVDRIVPATTATDRAAVAGMLGLRDEATVTTEPFSQWVIEDCFAGDRPRWEGVGAQLVADVAPYETAKLRMLNGAHSALAYLGLERGHTYVHEAVADPVLAPLIDRLMRDEAATSFTAAAGQNLATYADALIARFANPALRHRLDQIAMDGSQKIPQRWLATLAAQRERGVECRALLGALGAWLRYVRGDRWEVCDPLAARLRAAWEGEDIAGAAQAILGRGGLIPSAWTLGEADLSML